MKNKKVEISVIVLILILQTIYYIIFGLCKSYLHMDEAYSLGLAHYDKTEIQNNSDFYNTWHNGEYYEDYLVLNTDEANDYSAVYENQKNDVHPPFYYLLLRFSMIFTMENFSFWGGISLNIIIGIFITIFCYLILQKLLIDVPYTKEISAIISAVSALTLASVSNILYIRMYALLTLIVLITSYLHIKLCETETKQTYLIVFLGIIVLLGSLTHYYYFFFLFPQCALLICSLLKSKNKKGLFIYLSSMLAAGLCSLAIFPFSINHLFFGYRGKGALDNLFSADGGIRILQYLGILYNYAFNCLIILIPTIIAFLIIKKTNKITISISKSSKITFLFLSIPTLIYFIICALSSPWIELRYILPICSILLIIAVSVFFIVSNSVFGEKTSRIIMLCLAVLFLIRPIITSSEPEFVYSNRAEIVNTCEENSNCPAIYVFNSSHNRFLDDILLFSKFENSYIAKDTPINENSVNEIFKNKETSTGVFVIINEGNEHNDILNTIQTTLDLNTVQFLTNMNACSVYFIH